MRIAYVTDSTQSGRAQQAADGLRAHGHMVKHVARSPLAQRVRAFAAPVCSDEAAAQSAFVAPTAAALVRHWQQRLPDLVHVATAGPLGWAAVSASRHLNRPVSTEFDSTGAAACPAALAPLVNRYLRVFHNRADICFVATEAARDGLAQRGHQRLCVLGGTVGTDEVPALRRCGVLRKSWGCVNDEDLVLLHVGPLERDAHTALALQAYRSVLAFQPNCRMVVVGEGSLRSALQASFPEACFVGAASGTDLARHIASTDLLIGCSATAPETLEARRFGLVVVAVDEAGGRFSVGDGCNGVLQERGDSAVFLRQVHRAVALASQPTSTRHQARDSARALRGEPLMRNFNEQLLQLAARRFSSPRRQVFPSSL